MKLRTKIIHNAIAAIEDGDVDGCCLALDGQIVFPHDSHKHHAATESAMKMLRIYFKPRNKSELQYFWPVDAKYTHRWADGSSTRLEHHWDSPQHQRHCVTPRIIALQILALLSEELP